MPSFSLQICTKKVSQELPSVTKKQRHAIIKPLSWVVHQKSSQLSKRANNKIWLKATYDNNKNTNVYNKGDIVLVRNWKKKGLEPTFNITACVLDVSSNDTWNGNRINKENIKDIRGSIKLVHLSPLVTQMFPSHLMITQKQTTNLFGSEDIGVEMTPLFIPPQEGWQKFVIEGYPLQNFIRGTSNINFPNI